MLAYAAMGFRPGSEVILPSFTFAATAQAVLWNSLIPVYVDCFRGTMTIDPDEVVKAIGPSTAAICPVTIFGLPPDIDELESISARHGLPLIFDSAQGLGARYKGRRLGPFGLCEVFSMSPTKVITAVEGGVLTTNDSELASKIISMRDYGKGPDGQEMIYNGLSARQSEFHAAVGLLGIANAESLISSRLKFIQAYRNRLGSLPGCRAQEFPGDRTSGGNYFTLLVGPEARMNRDKLYDELKAHNIQSKRYFFPPVHMQKAFRNAEGRVVGDLANTIEASDQSLALPLFSHMTEEQWDKICVVVEKVLY
jgi:dTDP-4-amino-4,6-dideoxygalactose transaminase